MPGKNKARVGVEINFNVIKITHFTLLGKAISERYPVPPDINRVEFLDFIKSSIHNFIAANRLKSVSFNFSVAYDENNGRIGFLGIPKLDKKSTDKAMKYELQDKNAEENLDNFHILNEKVESGTDNNRVSYASVIMKKDLIAALSSLKKITWTVESLELRPVTIGRLVDDNSVVIDYGRRNTFLYYYKNGVMVDISPIPSGWLRINEIIDEIYPGLTADEMHELKNQIFLYDDSKDYSLDTVTWGEDEPDIEVNINDLSNLEKGFDKDVLMEISLRATQEIKYITEEIKRLLRAFELSQDIMVNNLYFTGDTANFDDYVRLFSEELQIDTLPLSRLLTAKDLEVSEEFSVSAMATMYSDIKYFRNLNFEKFIKNNYDMGSMFIAVLIMSILIHAGMYHLNGLYDQRAEELKLELAKQQNEISTIDAEIDSAKQREAEVSDFSAWLTGISEERIMISEFFHHLPRITPNGVAFSKITVQDGLVTLRGYSRNYTNVGFLAIELEKLGGISIESIDRPTEEKPLEKVVVENILDNGKKETFNSNNEFTIVLKAPFPLNTHGAE